MRNFWKFGVSAFACLVHAFAAAQMAATAYSGAFTVDNQPYNGGPILWLSLGRIAAGGLNPATSAVWLAPQPKAPGNTHGRTMMQYKSGGSGDLSTAQWLLPSQNNGSTSSAELGEVRVVSTWTPGWCLAPMNDHVFRSEVSLDNSNGQAWVDIDIQEAPRPFFVKSYGEFEHGRLDGGPYDQDPSSGSVVINRDSTPSISLEYSMPSFEMRRDPVQWQDGTKSNSTFHDKAFSSIWIIFDSPEGQYVFRGDTSDPILFSPGEGASEKMISGFGGAIELDMTQVRSGSYEVHYWAVPWTADFASEQGDIGCYDGFVAFEHIEFNVQVVPEPGTVTALALGGLGALVRKRRRPSQARLTESALHNPPGASSGSPGQESDRRGCRTIEGACQTRGARRAQVRQDRTRSFP